jgi:crotonobetainyl-CoA:carnitine CoA-transferase CaiB-like acyl-CoA transferase
MVDDGAEGAGGPLSGLLVADFSRVLAGPYATMLLADLGAEVIKVESPQGDETRTWMPPTRGETSTYYLGINRGKRSIALDLRDEADVAVAKELARRADILIENLRPGGMAKYGLDYASVAEDNPGLVYASISGFGSTGGGHVPGLMSLTGSPDGPPFRAGISIFDVMAGKDALIGILAALRHRDATGRGQHVELSLLASAMSGMVNQSSAYAAGGVVPSRMGNAHPSVVPYEPLPTADNDLIVAAANDGQFRKLCGVLGLPELADDPRFVRNADRTEHRDELKPILIEALSAKGADEWFDLLVSAGVPAGPINSIAGGFAIAERFGLDPVVAVGEGDRAVPTTRNPIRFSDTPVTYELPPPELDEHGDEIRKWLTTDA